MTPGSEPPVVPAAPPPEGTANLSAAEPEPLSAAEPEPLSAAESQPLSAAESEPASSAAEPTPKLLQLRDGLPMVVETQAGLETAVASFGAASGPVAIDAERASGHRYSQRAYLLQLRREGVSTVLIDPIPFGEVPNEAFAPLSRALSDAEWIIHAASQDLPCLIQLGLRPVHLFDTELAGRLLNYPRVGLAVLIEELLGHRMRKEHSAVDWSKRPLPEPWLLYAALDVEMLIELRHVLATQLEQTGKAEWAAQEFAAWAAMVTPAPRHEPWRRTSGIHRIRGRRGLALVRAMWELRDQLARHRDVSSSRVLTDSAIIEAASAAPKSRNALSRLSGFANRGGQRYAREFAAVIGDALKLADKELPALAPRLDGPPPPRTWNDKDPEAAGRLQRCRVVIAELAEQYDLPQENLIAPDAVRRLAWRPPDPCNAETVRKALVASAARPWQVELTAATLADALVAD